MRTGRARLESCARLVLTAGLLGLLLLPPIASLGCARPGGYRPQQRIPTLPITRSERERPNKITYYLASMTQREEQVVLDMDLMNGMSRGFQSCTVWVTLLGSQGQKQRISYPLGPLGPHAQDHVIVKAENVGFQVDDISVGVELR